MLAGAMVGSAVRTAGCTLETGWASRLLTNKDGAEVVAFDENGAAELPPVNGARDAENPDPKLDVLLVNELVDAAADALDAGDWSTEAPKPPGIETRRVMGAVSAAAALAVTP